MKLFFPVIVLTLFICGTDALQTDSSALLKEVTIKLQNHSMTVSSIPTEKKYAHLHPLVTFREMIRKYSSMDVLAIATNVEPDGTEFLFQDDERLKGEILNLVVIDGGIIAIPEATEAPFAQKFSYEFKIRKE